MIDLTLPSGGGSGSGDLLAANNLSDVASVATSRTNLGLTALAVTTPGTGVATALGVALGSAGSVLVTNYAADAGASDTYAATLSPAPSAYVTGAHYRFKANTSNTGAATINFNSLGAISIVKVAGGITTSLADNDIRAGQWVDLVYDGTNMQMQSTLGNAGGGLSAPTLAGINSITSATGQALTLATLDSNANVLLTPHGTGQVKIPNGTIFGTDFISFGGSHAASGIMYSGSGPMLFAGYVPQVYVESGLVKFTGVVEILQAAALGTVATDSARIGAKDVAGTAEMFVKDEAGNETQISPHNHTAPAHMIDSAFDEVGYTANYYTGIVSYTNKRRMVARVAKAQYHETFEEHNARLNLTGDRALVQRDWATVQAAQVAARDAERTAWLERKTAWEADPNHAGQPFTEPEPALLVAKPVPAWLTTQLAERAAFFAERDAALARKVWTSFRFLKRFTSDERKAIKTKGKTDDIVADFELLATAAQEILSDDPETIAGMNYLVSVGVLTEQRKNEILSGA